jgi:ADP-ribose pyrophosphatase YjhB (NUDIX family)
MYDDYRHCSRCGAPLEMRAVKAGEPARPVCKSCGFVVYLDPKVAVGTIIRLPDNGIVLVRRGIEPGYGLWVFPGGYIDRGETLEAGAVREAREECGLDIRIDRLLHAYSYPGRVPVVIVYTATALGGTMHASNDESLEVRSFSPDTIPWGELAFDSTVAALKDYFGLGAGR